ncbi:MAG: hypothetical protein JWR72_1570 [Flavisolibacter sp.]|jgi:hypothetical protein|nr:hypothetical protein [Flavisolibacter sp.]
MQDNTITAIETQVDKKQYSDDELISIKTTLNLPYYTSSAEYERAYGSINIDGRDYEYVKRRVYNDTLELLCIPNGAKTKLQSINNNLAKASADGGASTPDKKSNTVLKIALPDFCEPIKTYTAAFVSNTKQDYYSSNSHLLLINFAERQERPPQSMQPFIS